VNRPDIGFRGVVTPKRSPVIINQLGAELRSALVDHWSRPQIIDHPPEREPWDIFEDADVLLTRPNIGWDKAPAEKPSGWPFALRWIQSAATGLDVFPPWLLDGPVVTVGRGISADLIAEYVLAAILDFEKRLQEVRVRRFSDWKLVSLGSLGGKTIGIAGFGAIGRAIAARARPFDLSIKALRRSPWRAAETDIEPVDSIAALVEQSDHLVIALPATSKTTGLINADILGRAKPSLHLINVARGKIVDQEALLQALDSGRIARATLDVTDPEPPQESDPILSHPKVVLTPHISWTGGESTKRLADKTLANLNAYLHGAPLADVFDKTLEY